MTEAYVGRILDCCFVEFNIFEFDMGCQFGSCSWMRVERRRAVRVQRTYDEERAGCGWSRRSSQVGKGVRSTRYLCPLAQARPPTTAPRGCGRASLPCYLWHSVSTAQTPWPTYRIHNLPTKHHERVPRYVLFACRRASALRCVGRQALRSAGGRTHGQSIAPERKIKTPYDCYMTNCGPKSPTSPGSRIHGTHYLYVTRRRKLQHRMWGSISTGRASNTSIDNVDSECCSLRSPI